MLTFGGGALMPKVEKTEAEVTVQEHSLKWWLDRGVKCPDCGEIKFLIIQSQQRGSLARCATDKWDAHYTANIICGVTNMWDVDAEIGCGCKFHADFVEKEAIHKKSIYERTK